VIENHPHRSLADFGRKLVGRLARHGSTFSDPMSGEDRPALCQNWATKTAGDLS